MDRERNSGKIDAIIVNTIWALLLILWVYLSFTEAPDFLWGRYGAIFIGIPCAIIAAGKNRNPFAWFVAGTWFILISAIILLCLPSLFDRLCPYCKKGISNEAVICPYCRQDVPVPDIKEMEPAQTYYG